MKAEEIQTMTEETVENILDIVETIDEKQASFWKRPSKPEIDYLLTTIGQLCSALLDLSRSLVTNERLLAHDHRVITEQQRTITALSVKVTQQAGEIAFLKENACLPNQIQLDIQQKEES